MVDVKKQDDKGKAAVDIRKEDDKRKANSVPAGVSATGRQKPSLAPNMKITVLDGEKQGSKRKANAANAGVSALPVLKPKSFASEGKRPDGRDKGDRRRQLDSDCSWPTQAVADAEIEDRHN